MPSAGLTVAVHVAVLPEAVVVAVVKVVPPSSETRTLCTAFVADAVPVTVTVVAVVMNLAPAAGVLINAVGLADVQVAVTVTLAAMVKDTASPVPGVNVVPEEPVQPPNLNPVIAVGVSVTVLPICTTAVFGLTFVPVVRVAPVAVTLPTASGVAACSVGTERFTVRVPPRW